MTQLITIHLAVDKDCGHVHGGSKIEGMIREWVEDCGLAGYPLDLVTTSVADEEVDAACLPSGLGTCERCQLRRDAHMHVIFRTQVASYAVAHGVDPFEAVRRYELLGKLHPRMPHSAIAKSVQQAILTGNLRAGAAIVDFEAIKPEDFQR